MQEYGIGGDLHGAQSKGNMGRILNVQKGRHARVRRVRSEHVKSMHYIPGTVLGPS